MSLKSKLITIITAFCMIVATLLIGVFAVRQVEDFNVGGDIGFTATGVNATISKATLTNLTSTNSNKMQAVTINTGYSETDVNALFASWRNLNLKISEGATSATISFTITNNNSGWKYFEVNPQVTVGSQDNIVISVDCTSGYSAILAKETSTFTITFTPIDAELDGYLSDFGVQFDMEYKEAVSVHTGESGSTLLSVNEDAPNTIILTAELADGVDVEIPSVIEYLYWNDETDNTSSDLAVVTNISSTANEYGATWTPTSLILPSTLETISDYAFQYCGLTSIEIPYGVNEMGVGAFSQCASLKSIKLPNTLTSISEGCFYDCDSLETIEIPYGVTKIEQDAFGNCGSLKSIKLPNSLKEVEAAFYYCISLEELIIPDSVTDIIDNDEDFMILEGCSALKNVVIGKGVTEIHSGLLYDCAHLESLTIPFVGGSATANQFLDYIFGGTDATATTKQIPSTLTTVVVTGGTSIPLNAFRRCTSIEKIILPDTITSIGNTAFWHCESLSEIILPDSVTTIGQNVFNYCYALKKLIIPDSVVSFGDSSASAILYQCTALEELTIPFVGQYLNGTTNTNFAYIFASSGGASSVPTSLKTVIVTGGTSIAADAFANCTSLTTVSIPNTVTSIGAGAFTGCTSLQKLSIPFVGGSTSANQFLGYLFGRTIDQSGTDGYPGTLTTVVVTGGTSIPSYAFYYCKTITTIVIPDTVTSIGAYAFYCCTQLTNIKIPYGVTTIGGYAFYDCGAITSLEIPESVTSIDGYALGCYNITSLTIPINAVPGGYLGWCFVRAYAADPSTPSSLTSVKITGSYITKNYQNASPFTGCSSITDLTLGEGISHIISGALDSLTGLSTLTCLSKTPPILGSALPSSITSIKVPSASVATYQATTYWSDSSSIISAI